MRHRRRKLSDETHNHERWLLSYADFVTLLFAFFVVMYSISAVNEEKYKAFASSLELAFLKEARENDPISIEVLPVSIKKEPIQIASLPFAMKSDSAIDLVGSRGYDLAAEKKQLQDVSAQLMESLKALIDDNMVSLKKTDYWIELELNSELLFLSGDAELTAGSKSLLKKIAQVFKPIPNAINVEGHTDTNPINTAKFPSNWELSSARATSVVQEFMKEGIEPSRMAAIGYAQYHPVADNKFKEGQFKNRRVVMLLMSRGLSRYDAGSQALINLIRNNPDPTMDKPAK